jgi:hypothetical protein
MSCCLAGWRAGRALHVRSSPASSWDGGRYGIGFGWILGGGGEAFVLDQVEERVCRVENGRMCGR